MSIPSTPRHAFPHTLPPVACLVPDTHGGLASNAGFPWVPGGEVKASALSHVKSSVDMCGRISETLVGIRNTCWWSHSLNSAGPPELPPSYSLEADRELAPHTAALWSSSGLRAIIFCRQSSILKKSDKIFYSEPSMCTWLPRWLRW